MAIRILAIGKRMPAWVETAYADYAKRLPKEFKPELVELNPFKTNQNHTPDFIKQQESTDLIAQIKAQEHIVALDKSGVNWSTEQLASNLKDWQFAGKNIAFIIGGAEGLNQDCLQRADQRWSLSNLVLPHPLVRVILIEQLYRAWSYTQGHPYHRA